MNKGLFILLLIILVKWGHADGNWNGKACAFSFTTDDGYKCNLDWKIIFDRFGYHFTVFVNPLRGELSVEDLNFLHSAGHEIGSHSMTHRLLIKNTAFTIQYVGNKGAWIRILGDTLYLYSEEGDNYNIVLTEPFCKYLVDLVHYIDSLPSYNCKLDYYPDRNWMCESKYLVEIPEPAPLPYQVLTENGSSKEDLIYEVCESKWWLDSVILDPLYECRTFAYPLDAHDEREMIVVRDMAEYIAARNGSTIDRPWGTKGKSVWDTVTLYEIPQGPGAGFLCGNNSFTEEQTRDTIRKFIAEWKRKKAWVVTCVHTLSNIDTLHLSWILDELQRDGDVWVETFGKVAEYVRLTHYTKDGWNWVPKVDYEKEEKSDIVLGNNYYFLPTSCKVNLLLYDCAGRLIKIIDSGRKKSGTHRFSHPSVPAGIYFLVLQTKKKWVSRKLILIK